MMIEFEPSILTANEAKALIAVIAIFQPGVNVGASYGAGVGLRFTPTEDRSGERTAEEAFAATAPASDPLPDPADAFAQEPGPLAGGDAPIVAEPVGSPPPPPSADAPASNPSDSVDVDSTGAAWNAELHTSTKAKNKDGTWRTKRNTAGAVPTPPAAPTSAAPSVPPPPVTPESATPATPASPDTVTPPAPPPPAAPSPPGPPVAARPNTFLDLMKWVTGNLKAGKLTNEQLSQCLTMAGVDGLSDLRSRDDLLPTVVDLVESYIAA